MNTAMLVVLTKVQIVICALLVCNKFSFVYFYSLEVCSSAHLVRWIKIEANK